MSLPGLLCQVGLKQLFDVTSTEVTQWVDSRFEDSSRTVLHTVFEANRRTWTVIGLALTERTFAGRVRDLIREGDLKAARDEIRQLIAATPPEHRIRAASELDTLHERHRDATTDTLSGADALFRRFGDPAGVAAEADRAAGLLPDALAADAPHLVLVLRLTPDGRTPLFQALFRYHFRKRAGKTPELSGLLLHDQLRALAEQTDGRTSGILDQFDVLFDRIDAGLAELKAQLKVMDAKLDKLLKDRAVTTNTRDPLKVTVTNTEELAQLRRWRDELRELPPELVGSAIQSKLGDALAAARMYTEARQAHEAAARAAADRTTRAEAEFKAYRDACEAGAWLQAFEALWKAVELEPDRYSPFDRHRYRPERVLGGGAFGTVFLCHDEYEQDDDGKPRPVAIKSFRTDALDRDLVKVFAEARTLKALAHPNIIGVIDQGFGNTVTRERPYLILEYFAGQTLDQLGALPLFDFFTIARQVGEAVHAAHSRPQPIFHRDLKPSNIMVQRNPDGTWTVKVIDFGLAVRASVALEGKAVPPANRSTKDKSVTGTLKYAPPEQTGVLSGVEVGPYSDVYAFGKTCLDVLFGHTQPDDEEWGDLPEPSRGGLKKLLGLCVRHSPSGKFPRLAGFAPVLSALAELDQAETANRECEAEEQRKREEAKRQDQQRAREQEAADHHRAERVRLAAEAAEKVTRERQESEAERFATEQKLKAEEEARSKRETGSIVVQCPHCKTRFNLQSEMNGKAMRCTNLECRNVFVVRALEEKGPTYGRSPQPDHAAKVKPVVDAVGVEAEVADAVVVPPKVKEVVRSEDTDAPSTKSSRKTSDPLSPTSTRTPGQTITFKLPGDVPVTFAWCPPGSFRMGSEKGDSDEKPDHKVTLTKGFFMGIHPVTQAQWKAVMGTDPSHFKGPTRPVESVTWTKCAEFCTKLTSFLKGRAAVRLPTEAEWEYACRAGTTTEYWCGNDEAALKRAGWYTATSKGETQPVGQLEKNPWGLYDVHGNVWEWCLDSKREYTAKDEVDPQRKSNNDSRVLRGGCWGGNSDFCRAAHRSWSATLSCYHYFGFRVCLRLD